MTIQEKYQLLITISAEYTRLVERMVKLGGWKYFPAQDKNRMMYLKGKIIQIEMMDKVKNVTQQTIFQ